LHLRLLVSSGGFTEPGGAAMSDGAGMQMMS
jgi:hypothetical protein